MMNHASGAGDRGGIVLGLLAYLAWGFLPLYFRTVHAVPPVELVGWRVMLTLPLCIAVVAWRRQAAELVGTLKDPRAMGALAASALLIGGNWLIYVAAINSGHVLATSMGYYINPLLNVLLGTIVLKERLSRLQWGAVAVAATGVALLLAGAIETLGIAVALALTFASYGLVRKVTPVGAVPGLAIETILLLLPAVGILGWFAQSPQGSSMGKDAAITVPLLASGAITAVPLLLFAAAARKVDLSTLGFLQFVAPTIAFILGVTVFHEALSPIRLASFALIWLAIGLFAWDILSRRGRAR